MPFFFENILVSRDTLQLIDVRESTSTEAGPRSHGSLVQRPSMNAACPLLMTTFTNCSPTMPTTSLLAMVSDAPKAQAIKRAQDLPDLDEFRAQCEWAA